MKLSEHIAICEAKIDRQERAINRNATALGDQQGRLISAERRVDGLKRQLDEAMRLLRALEEAMQIQGPRK